tara:strand:- start:915 stop:1124 length:210 start_codon:yes stop_codon:yes gene_type:complete
MFDGIYFMRIYNDLKNNEIDKITFSEAMSKYGLPETYKTTQSAPGYDSKLIVELCKSNNEVIYRLRDEI